MSVSTDNFVAPPCVDEIEIIYQDETILLINKPSGLLTLSGKNPLNLDSVHYRLVQQFPGALMIHRLDLGTSGLLVVALNKIAAAHINRQFQLRTVNKTYQAVLAGHMTADSGDIELPIAKDPVNFPKLKVCFNTGKPASSHYEVLDRQADTTRVLFTPHTGRTHQLRIHSAGIGHPILGCDLYGTPESAHMASRLLLHAMTLEFDHPLSGERMRGISACPF
ncbi:RNA pseudouridine synthase [Herminiimonas sp. KBW02]|uniref:RluA family pseudouridine synthase n=1 Tax=Herminiimonas sp. KBW02 TaxID=2153363 RepID=UPI000F595108|nr:RluA family pseudouridine synthase [Herminiimonas sp. KBW02]RQO33476.1 RNA pseudouridine synthase [Herminiimonas sp. KBW02]